MVEVDERHAARHVTVSSTNKEQPEIEAILGKNTTRLTCYSNSFRYLKFHLEDAKIPPLTAPKVEQATKNGISQRNADPNNLFAKVCKRVKVINLSSGYITGSCASEGKTYHCHSIG